MSWAVQDMKHKWTEIEKLLRDNIKWMMADSESWVKSLKEREAQLDRVSDDTVSLPSFETERRPDWTSTLSLLSLPQALEKYIGIMNDPDQCAREASRFLDQDDAEVLEVERPPEDREEMNMWAGKVTKEGGPSYMLSRFMGNPQQPHGRNQKKHLKSMQHFFLKVSESRPAKRLTLLVVIGGAKKKN